MTTQPRRAADGARRGRRVAVVALVLLGRAVSAGEPFQPSADLDLPRAVELVVGHMPAIESVELDADLARADLHQSRLTDNPALDLSWGTIPVGETNPVGLKSPLSSVPNYGVGLSYRIPLGKRGPRIARAEGLLEGARQTRQAIVRQRALELVRSVGAMAAAMMRREGGIGIHQAASRALEVARSRLAASFGTPLDVDRLEIEVNRARQQILRAEAEIEAAEASCSQLVGLQCLPFASVDGAREFLVRWIEQPVARDDSGIEERPDLRALAALGEAARAEERLARNLAIPDPTLRLGYLYDTFLVSGNQGHSLNVQASLPLPVVDHGQAAREAAGARASRIDAQRAKLLAAARARIPALREALAAQRRREKAICEEMLPRARGVLDALAKAAANRLVPITDVIQSQRALSDLQLEESSSVEEAFLAALDLLAELPPSDGTAPRGEGRRPGGETGETRR